MPTTSPKLGIQKPLGTDPVNRQSFNTNWDIIDQNAQKEIPKSAVTPSNPVADDLWLDTSVTPNVLKRYVNSTTGWVKVTPTTASEVGAETPSGAQGKVDTHAALTSTHGATSAATASRIMMRDSAGRAKVAAPSASDDIARKDTVDAVQANLTNHINATDPHAQYALDTDLSNHISDYVDHIGYGATAGTNAYTVTLNPAPTAYVDGMAIALKIGTANTGAATINVNSLGAKALKKANGTDFASSQLKAGSIYTFRYNSATGNFIAQGEGGEYGTAGAAQVLSGYTYGSDTGIQNGTMPNNGAVGGTITEENGLINIPAGYTTGGTVNATYKAGDYKIGDWAKILPYFVDKKASLNGPVSNNTAMAHYPPGWDFDTEPYRKYAIAAAATFAYTSTDGMSIGGNVSHGATIQDFCMTDLNNLYLINSSDKNVHHYFGSSYQGYTAIANFGQKMIRTEDGTAMFVICSGGEIVKLTPVAGAGPAVAWTCSPPTRYANGALAIGDDGYLYALYDNDGTALYLYKINMTTGAVVGTLITVTVSTTSGNIVIRDMVIKNGYVYARVYLQSQSATERLIKIRISDGAVMWNSLAAGYGSRSQMVHDGSSVICVGTTPQSEHCIELFDETGISRALLKTKVVMTAAEYGQTSSDILLKTTGTANGKPDLIVWFNMYESTVYRVAPTRWRYHSQIAG